VIDEHARAADRTLRMRLRDLLVGEGNNLAALTDGYAEITGRSCERSTIGLYRLRSDRLAECRLNPFDQTEFDSIWNPAPQPGG
jgi:hypothetical protein